MLQYFAHDGHVHETFSQKLASFMQRPIIAIVFVTIIVAVLLLLAIRGIELMKNKEK